MASIIRTLAIAAIFYVIAPLANAQNGPRVPVVVPDLWQLSRGPRDDKVLDDAFLQVYAVKWTPRLTIAGLALSGPILRSTEMSFAPGSLGNFDGGSRPFGGGLFGGPSGGGLFGGQNLPNEPVKKR